jgi:dTDP-4-dehydrorhamnose reductase
MQNIKKFKIDKHIVVICGGSGQLGKKISKFLKKNKAIIVNFDLNNEKTLYLMSFLKQILRMKVKLN